MANFSLRELSCADVKIINQWRNNPDLIANLGAPFRFINPETDEAWFNSYLNSRSNTIRCVILENDRILGLVSLTGIDFINRSAELHIMIGDAADRGRGVGTFAVSSMLFHAFNNMNLERVELGVLAGNLIAQKLYKKCGFSEEGRRRKAIFKNGQYVDLIQMAILKDEFQSSNLSTNWGGVVLPDFCISKIEDKMSLENILKKCGIAFEPPLWEMVTPFDKYIEKLFFAAKIFAVHTADILGMVAIYDNDFQNKTAYITQVMVAPESQGHGVGNALMQFVEDYVSEKKMKKIRLEVHKKNVRALALYKKFNFEIESDNGEKWYMSKDLTAEN